MKLQSKIPKAKGKFPWHAAYRMITDPTSFLLEKQKEIGDLFQIDAPRKFYVVSHPADVAEILKVTWRKNVHWQSHGTT